MKPSRDIFVQYRVINGIKYIMKNYKVFQLDEIEEMIWDSFDGHTTIQQIAEKIADIYKVEHAIVLQDVELFVQEMLEKELVEV
ncbi:PqqD family protein [Bacillus toyonensis]|uniref:PqqD family protein n=1 Tax=Bacillus toyonensis TaxID=155322 RepID=UPI003D21F067